MKKGGGYMKKAIVWMILILTLGCSEKDLSQSLLLQYNRKNIPDAGISLSSDESASGTFLFGNVHETLPAVIRGISSDDKSRNFFRR